MKTPFRVAVTGAAGQIGYSLLFRIASGQLLGPDQPGHPPAARDHPGPRRAQGRRHGARGLRLPAARRRRADRRRQRGLRATPTSPCSSAAVPAARAWSARTCSRPTAPSSPCRARPSSDNAADDVSVLVVGNPANTNALIAMNNAAEHPERALHRHDPPRPQPGHGPARRQDRHHGQRHHEDDDLGQPLGHPVPRPLPRRGQRARTPPSSSNDQAWLEGDFIPTVQQRGAAIIEARGARPAPPRPPTPPSTTCAPGSPAPPRATGSRWPSRPTAATACPRASSPRSRSPPQDGEYTIVQGLEHRRVLPGPHRRLGRRAGRGARRRQGARPHLSRGLRPTGSNCPRDARSSVRNAGSSASWAWAEVGGAVGRSLLQELPGGVVGQHLAAGLAGGAVVHRVARCTRRPARCRRRPGTARRPACGPNPGARPRSSSVSRPRS